MILESFTPEHIITELLQNADDVGATFAEIELTDNGILFTHNGEDFNEKHLKALCDIGQTTKKPGIHIGFMGIGFKAAFKVSDKPYIFSGPYKFYFEHEDFFVPHWIEEIPKNIEERIKTGFTTFFLPFKHNLPSEVLEALKETVLTKVEPLCLVFLRKIAEIRIVCNNTLRLLTKTMKSKRTLDAHSLRVERVQVTEKKGEEERVYSYLVFKKTVEIPPHIKDDYRAKDSRRAELETTDVMLAFSLKESALKPEKSVLYTFLPTSFETGLRFAVNCDFLLNTQRTEPDLTSYWNLWMLEKIGDILKDIVKEFIRDKKLALIFYDVLPRKEEVSEMFFSKIGVPLINYMKENPCILTSDGKLAKPSEVVLASEDVQQIIPPSQAGVQFYANPKIQGQVFLRDELGVKDLTGKMEERKYIFETLQDKSWLTSLTEDQIRNIYEFLHCRIYGKGEGSWSLTWWDQEEVKSQLKEMNIIRATNGQYYKAGETLFPRKSEEQSRKLIDLPCLIFVNPAVLSDQSRQLLKKLGVKDFSDESVVDRILNSQAKDEWKDWTDDQRLKAISYVAEFVRKKNYQVKKEEFGDIVLPLEDGTWAPASCCYVPTPDLKEVLPNANFVDLTKIESVVEEAKRFLNFIGVLTFPRVVLLEKKDRWEKPHKVSGERWEGYWSWLHEGGYLEYSTTKPTISSVCLDGFDECISTKNKEKIEKYLNFLLEHWNAYYKNYLISYYYWFYYSEREKKVPSYFEYQLKVHKWLPTSQGLKSPGEIFAPLKGIKRVCGNLVPYLKISEEQVRKGKEFLQFLNIKTEIDLETLLLALNMARSSEVNDTLKAQLSHIYKKLADICEDENIEKEIYILDTKGNFQPSRELIWADYPGVEEIFGEELPLAWVPDNLSKPEIERLFDAVGVRRISLLMERKMVEGQEMTEDIQLKNNLVQKKTYLYSLLRHSRANKSEKFLDFIKKVMVMRGTNLKLQLKVSDKKHDIEVPCFCSIEEGKIYVSSKAELMDIARELTNVFEAPFGTEFAINFVLSQRSVERISNELKNSGIQLITLPEVIPTPFKEEVAEEIQEVIDKFRETTESIIVSTPVIEEVADGFPEVDLNREEFAKEIAEATQSLTNGRTMTSEATDLWRESKEIEKVVSESRVVIRPFVSISSRKNWVPQIIDGERVFVEVNIDPAKVEAVKPFIKDFKKRMRKIVEVMGGNPDTVNICIAKPQTDGDRREGQLFFNILRYNKNKPFRWIVVAARELAYLKIPKINQAHISLMADLIEKALENIDGIYPETFHKVLSR